MKVSLERADNGYIIRHDVQGMREAVVIYKSYYDVTKYLIELFHGISVDELSISVESSRLGVLTEL